MAKDTEKLIRQLSLIAYLMAERRPVTATEIRRDVEGYSDMTEDAFARRFYADRAELDSLGIHLTVDKPADGFSEQENYSLAPEAFFLPAVAFSDGELAALQTALSLLDGEFAYAEPLRLALQQLTWGRPSPLGSPAQRAIGLGITGSAGGGELSARLAKLDTAIYRRKRIEFEYYTMQTGETAARVVDPYELLFEGGQFYLVGFSHERGDGARLPALAHPRQGGLRHQGRARLPAPRRLRPARLREPHPVAARRAARRRRRSGCRTGSPGTWSATSAATGRSRTPTTAGASSARPTRSPAWCSPGRSATSRTRACSTRPSWPTSCTAGSTGWPSCTGASRPSPSPPAARRRTRTASGSPARARARRARSGPSASPAWSRSPPCSSRRGGRARSCASRTSAAQLQISPQELREDVSVLNVVNFGGGAYVLYAEIVPGGLIEVDPEPYSDTFDRPARLLPIEARALLAAIELLGVHLSEDLVSAKEKLQRALGTVAGEGLLVSNARTDDAIARRVGEAIEDRRLVELEYYASNEDRFSTRVSSRTR